MTLRTSSRRRTRLAAVALGVSALMLGATACSSGGGAPSGSATLWGLTGTDEDTVLGPSLKEWHGANADGQVAFTLTTWGRPGTITPEETAEYMARSRETAARATQAIGGRAPA